jgi:hypothetical protein
MTNQDAIITPFQRRIRINVSTSVKGVKTFDATVEHQGEGATIEAALAESDQLVAELDQRYPKEG